MVGSFLYVVGNRHLNAGKKKPPPPAPHWTERGGSGRTWTDAEGSIRAVAAAAKGPLTKCIMVAPGPLLAGVPRKHVKIQVANGPLTECVMAAPGPLLAGVARKRVKIRACWAAEILFLPPIECILGPICFIAVLRGSLKCVIEARSPQIGGLRSVLNSDVLV